MTRQPEYLQYLEQAKRAEVAERLRSDGFVTEFDDQDGELTFDLVARKGTIARAYEFKYVGSDRLSSEVLARLQKSARERGLEFHLVIASPPPRVSVEVEDLREKLLQHLMNDVLPSELDSLSTHTKIENLEDIQIAEIHVGKRGTAIRGSGSVQVMMEYGSSADDGMTLTDAFPFHFSIELDTQGNLQRVEQFTVDTSSFEE